MSRLKRARAFIGKRIKTEYGYGILITDVVFVDAEEYLEACRKFTAVPFEQRRDEDAPIPCLGSNPFPPGKKADMFFRATTFELPDTRPDFRPQVVNWKPNSRMRYEVIP